MAKPPAAPTTSRSVSWLPGYLGAGIAWGASFLFIKIALDDFTVWGVSFGRQALGALTLIAWTLITGTPWLKDKRIWGHVFIVALLLNSLPGTLYAIAETTVSSSLAGILNATTPFMTVLAIWLFFRGERVALGQFIGLILGFFGVVILSGQLFEPGSIDPVGVALCLGATACYGVSYAYTRRFLSGSSYSATSMMTAQLIAATVWLLPLTVFTPLVHRPLSPGPVVSMLILGAIGTGFAYIWNYRTISIAGSTVASTVTYISPLVAILAGWIVLGEELHWYVLLGGAIVLLGAALVQQRLPLPRWAK